MTTGGGPPTGICVSGGGLRAAAFGLGALQVLQQELGLLRGPRSADLLSAVSGGSYIAGAYTLVNCSDRLQPEGAAKGTTGVEPPLASGRGKHGVFAPGSPEAEHLRRHCRYMVEDGGARTTGRLLLLVVLNLASTLALAAWLGVLIGFFGKMTDNFLGAAGAPGADAADFLATTGVRWPLALLGLGLISALVQSMGRNFDAGPWLGLPGSPRLRRVLLYVVLPLAAALSCYEIAAIIEESPLLRSPAWLTAHAVKIAVVLGLVAMLTCLCGAIGRRAGSLTPMFALARRVGVSLLTLRLVQVVGVLVVAWFVSWVYRDDSEWSAYIQVGAVTCVVLALARFVDRASPHHPYRDLLIRCFSVIRTAEGVSRPTAAKSVLLSQLRPPEQRGDRSFPELLICAAANVSDAGATPAGSNVLSLVISPTEVCLPAIPDAKIPTVDLEGLSRPNAGLRGWGPAITLPSAVAITGAAVSPAMGKHTRNNVRALFAALGVRLGVWLPNIIRSDNRIAMNQWAERVHATTESPEHPEPAAGVDEAAAGEAGASKKPPELLSDGKVRVSFSELVQELFGVHRFNGFHLYASDGGHYDNLGLVELIRRQCSVIWCIDASGDKPGRASALTESILMAAGEHGARVDIDLDLFALDGEGAASNPTLLETHAIGDVHYADGTSGVLIVLKLGLQRSSPPELHEYRRRDRRFPHHSTLNQSYRAERFDAYRSLGWASAHRALEDRDPRLAEAKARRRG